MGSQGQAERWREELVPRGHHSHATAARVCLACKADLLLHSVTPPGGCLPANPGMQQGGSVTHPWRNCDQNQYAARIAAEAWLVQYRTGLQHNLVRQITLAQQGGGKVLHFLTEPRAEVPEQHVGKLGAGAVANLRQACCLGGVEQKQPADLLVSLQGATAALAYPAAAQSCHSEESQRGWGREARHGHVPDLGYTVWLGRCR